MLLISVAVQPQPTKKFCAMASLRDELLLSVTGVGIVLNIFSAVTPAYISRQKGWHYLTSATDSHPCESSEIFTYLSA
jgi:hypothetical protein